MDNRNLPGGDLNDMFIFNEIIGHLGLLELPIKGRSYTWSNMQDDPLLEQLDWFFTSVDWISDYPMTEVLPLARTASDHVPCMVTIKTSIPKSNIFRFENYWLELEGFMDCVDSSWQKQSRKGHITARIADKFKSLRMCLKRWQKSISKLKTLICKCNSVILLLDELEEYRTLYRQESNFRIVVKYHVEKLLHLQCLYWRKRCTIRYIKVGGEHTKFFHAMAMERYRRNSIASLKLPNGTVVTDHSQMEGIIWDCFKNRMGSSRGINMGFDLSSLIEPVVGLDVLTKPFEKEEMDLIVKHMPVDKALGPDGFNGLFFKRCWHIISQDFYELAQAFFQGTAHLENINDSYITLVPKKPSPEEVGDYIPISLTGMGLKFLSKMAANRFQEYADDTLIILPADKDHLLALKDMLRIFSESTGLDVNYHKSFIIPINVDTTVMAELASAFGCQIGKMPFTYLVLPVGTTRPKMLDFMPLVDCMERRMIASSSFLNQGERLQFLNSALSSMPIFFLCSLAVPAGILKQLERIQRQCLWRRNRGQPAPSLAAWDLICRPKNRGGLGILNLGSQNVALLIKHANNFLNKKDLPWVSLIWDTYYHNRVPQGTSDCGSFWWKDICKVMHHFRECAWVQINAGNTALMWSDNLQFDGQVSSLQLRFPRLYSYVKDPWVTVMEFLGSQDIFQHFHLPLSSQAFDELTILQSMLGGLIRAPGSKDIWFWKGTAKGYSPKLNTKDMVDRRHWHLEDGVSCVLCPLHTRETRDHLFFNCNFSVRIWNYLQIDWSSGDSMAHLVLNASRSFRKPFFTEVVFIACWNIWIIRNAKVFRHERARFNKWRSAFIHDISLMQYRVKAAYKDDLLRWISFLPP
nr:uncharacterized protein LOC120967116 [Aegilops tauschii subsp. strangulata]